MRIFFAEKTRYRVVKWLLPIALLVLIGLNMSEGMLISVFEPNDEAADAIRYIFAVRNEAIINGDLESVKSMYNTATKYGTWAYEYEVRKVKYIHNWEKKQGVKFIEITPNVMIRSLKDKGDRFSANIVCSTEYKYIYEDKPEELNSCRIGTYHALDIMKKENTWIIAKEWYKDPFADSLNLNRLNEETVKQHILSQGPRDLSGILERRRNAVAYADMYCGAASEEQYGHKYNKKYRNYNSQGGDCANFASQILFEGGKFRKNKTWNHDRNGATRAWVNADGFKSYMVNSGRASVIAYGSYEKVYKASYKLLPGDFVAYEKKGDITHISVVTDADSRGYALVSCHNTDRSRVPWDLGWSNSSIRFWLVRVHY